MKAMKTRRYIEKIYSSGISIGVEHLPGVVVELEELELLARIGKATVKALAQGYNLIYNTEILGACDVKEIYSEKDLLKWAEGEGE